MRKFGIKALTIIAISFEIITLFSGKQDVQAASKTKLQFDKTEFTVNQNGSATIVGKTSKGAKVWSSALHKVKARKDGTFKLVVTKKHLSKEKLITIKANAPRKSKVKKQVTLTPNPNTASSSTSKNASSIPQENLAEFNSALDRIVSSDNGDVIKVTFTQSNNTVTAVAADNIKSADTVQKQDFAEKVANQIILRYRGTISNGDSSDDPFILIQYQDGDAFARSTVWDKAKVKLNE